MVSQLKQSVHLHRTPTMSHVHVDVVHKYHNAGPVSYDFIEDRLVLANLSTALDLPTLAKLNISHILTIDTCPLPRHILELRHLTTKFIQLTDLPSEDLLNHFDDTYRFIEEGIQKGGSLVHCYFGVSRSATVVIAYVMKKYERSAREALERVRAKRSLVSPNPGFMQQLRLYEEMRFAVDKGHHKYRFHRLQIAGDKVRHAKILPQSFFDVIKADPGLDRLQPEPNVYRCRKCRRIVASESNRIAHIERPSGERCAKMFFFEPLSWMDSITQVQQGKLHCPKCGTKLGAFSWIMGCRCPCGCEVSPAFYLTPSKIDASHVVKNVEVTI